MSLAVGQVVDQKYRILRLLGQGAMGAVFEGENVRIKRRVAIKVLHASVAAKKDLVDRFEREAQAAGRIGSGHIVDILDLGELPDGSRYLVMEFLEGDSLSSRIEKCGMMPPTMLMPLLRQLLVGLGAAHTAGIVHRDLKPDNIFLAKEVAGQRDYVKILDFGVSKFSVLNTEEARMTATGAVMGTPYYMSPEQAKGSRDIDARSDIFSVGVILYEAVTGRVPFDGETFNELMFKIALQDPPPPETIVPNLDPGIGRLIRKALAREPAQRFQDCAQFVTAIDEWMSTGRSAISIPPPGQVALKEAAPAPAGPNASTKADWSSTGAAPQPPKSRAGLFVGLAFAGMALGGGAYVALTMFGGTASAKGGAKTSAPTAAETATAAATTATATATASAAPDASAAPSAETSASAAPVESATPTATAVAATNTPTKAGTKPTKATATPTAAQTAAPKPTATGGRQPRTDI